MSSKSDIGWKDMKSEEKKGGNKHVSAYSNEHEYDGEVEGFTFAKVSGCSVNILQPPPTKQKAFLEPMILA